LPDYARYLDVIETIDGKTFALQDGGTRLEFSRAEFARRYARAAALMEESGIDALVLAQPSSIRYFIGLPTWVWVLPPVMPVIAILPRRPELATVVDTEFDRGGLEATTWISDLTLYSGGSDPIQTAVDALAERGLSGARLGLELGPGQRPNLTPNDLQRLMRDMSGSVIDASSLLLAVRMLKGPEEVDRLREACRLSQIGFEAAFKSLRIGSTEAGLTRVAAEAMLHAGARPGMEPFMLKFIAGQDRFPEHLLLSTERPVAAGEQVHADGGCAVDGYRCDFMRSAVIGRLSDGAESAYELAISALEAGLARLEPGKPLGNAWTAAADVFKAAGLDGGPTLTWGHGIGLDHWEPPQISAPGTPEGDLVARPGMVLCFEPSVDSESQEPDPMAGVFIVEDQVAVSSEGVEVLTSTLPRALFRASPTTDRARPSVNP
jgi:Xaa-Pro dipeptidase